MSVDRFDYDNEGCLDDVVVNKVEMFRLEYMSDNHIWIRLYRDGQPDIVINLSSESHILSTHHGD